MSRLVVVLVLALLVAGCGSLTDPSDSLETSPAVTDTERSAPIDPSTDDNAAAPALEPNATVERVVDGDTIIVDLAGTRERVRLLGIDTPESVAENRPDQCFGAEAAAYLAALLPADTPVTLIRDVEARDRYDRLLAYVVRTNDQLFVNLELLRQGFAAVMIFEPNSHYRDRFEDAETDARAAGTGLWGVCGGPDVPLDPVEAES